MQEVTHRAPREQLSAELQSIIEDVEALISATASETGEKASNARAKVKDALEKAKTSYDAIEGKALAHARARKSKQEQARASTITHDQARARKISLVKER